MFVKIWCTRTEYWSDDLIYFFDILNYPYLYWLVIKGIYLKYAITAAQCGCLENTTGCRKKNKFNGLVLSQTPQPWPWPRYAIVYHLIHTLDHTAIAQSASAGPWPDQFKYILPLMGFDFTGCFYPATLNYIINTHPCRVLLNLWMMSTWYMLIQ